MREIEVAGTRVAALTDCAPGPADCGYSFEGSAIGGAAARWFPGLRFETRFGPFLLRRPEGDVLVDCGLGPGPVGYFPGLVGRLDAALAAAGSGLDRVAAVVFTHLHVDHVGWAPLLTRARFFVAEAEWAHWRQGVGLAHHVAAVAHCIAPLAAAGRLEMASGAVLPGVELLPAAGHTPGHCAVLVDGRVLIGGDAWHNPAQIERPEWCHRADMDKAAAIAARRRLAARAAEAGWVVGAGHFREELAFGRIRAEGAGLQYAPLSAVDAGAGGP